MTCPGREGFYAYGNSVTFARMTANESIGRCVSIGYTVVMMKDSGLRIRVQRDLRAKFLEVCRMQDKPAAQVLREFMRNYVERHGPPAGISIRRQRIAPTNPKRIAPTNPKERA